MIKKRPIPPPDPRADEPPKGMTYTTEVNAQRWRRDYKSPYVYVNPQGQGIYYVPEIGARILNDSDWLVIFEADGGEALFVIKDKEFQKRFTLKDKQV